jgi:hypothetical protein
MESPREKKCTKCGSTKSVSEFYRKSTSRDGLECQCKRCISIHKRKYYQKYKLKEPLRRVWKGMIARCNDSNHPSYKNYGGRGIKVCERWLVYENFKEDMLPKYKQGLDIDRINNDIGYKLSNCHFITRKENCRNRRDNIKVNFLGKDRLLIGVAEEYGINYNTLWDRIFRHKWDIEKAISLPLQNNSSFITFNEKTLNIKEWSKEIGIHYSTLKLRLRSGWSIEKALTTPVRKKRQHVMV